MSLSQHIVMWREEVDRWNSRVWSIVVVLFLASRFGENLFAGAECVPPQGCATALAYYQIEFSDSLELISQIFQTSIDKVLRFNDIPNPNFLNNGSFLFVPFPCTCEGDHLGYSFVYEVQPGDESTEDIANNTFEGLSRADWIAAATPLNNSATIFPGFFLKVPVNCSCGDPAVSSKYGIFTTYVLQENDTLAIISKTFNTTADMVQRYNPGVDWSTAAAYRDIIFIPFTGSQGTGVLFNASALGGGVNKAAIIGTSVGGGLVIITVAIAGVFCFCIYLPDKGQTKDNSTFSDFPTDFSLQDSGRKQGTFRYSGQSSDWVSRSATSSGALPLVASDLTGEKSVGFSYDELAAATNKFNINNKIGEGGYGAVYYGVLRGQHVAIKRMNVQASREFLAELKVLTHVHHTNLVQLIGFCIAESLFLIYEFIDNGTLSEHLHGSGMPPLSWAARVQIALDSARGLEYIHEHTKPTYIHRDIKSSNILIDKNLHAKVADFGLTKLTESGIGSLSMTQPMRLVGTFGYMSPEYARFGDVSPKVDVYSFGVILFEMISAEEAIIRSGRSATSAELQEQKGLVTLFEAVLMDTGGKEKLKNFVDPALGNDYPLDSVWKMTQLAGACTQENPELRPSMRTVVVALMTLLSSIQDWENGHSGDQALGSLMSPL